MTSPRPQSLDEAFARTIRSMRVTELAARTGLSERWLYRWATPEENPSGEHRHPPAHVIEPISRATGRRDIVEFLAGRLGHLLVPCLSPREGTAAGLLGHVAGLTREFAEVQAEVAQVMVDGAVTSDEAVLVEQQLADLVREAETLRQLVRLAAVTRKHLAKVERASGRPLAPAVATR